MRKTMIVLMCIGILVSWQICQSDLANAGSKGPQCSLAGTWMWELVESFPPGAEENYDPILVTFIPLDPTGKRFAIIPDSPEPKVPDGVIRSRRLLINLGRLSGSVKISSNFPIINLG